MSLTKSDLAAIKHIVDNSMQYSLRDYSTRAELDKKLKSVKTQIRKSQNTIIAYFDRTVTHHTKRIDRLDNHLSLEHLPEPLPQSI